MERGKSMPWFGWVGVVAILPVLYVLSIFPVILVGKWLDLEPLEPWIGSFYSPLLWAIDEWDWLEKLMDEIADLLGLF